MSAQALWLNVLDRTLKDARAEDLPSNFEAEVVVDEARAWLTEPRYADQRTIVCEAAGVEEETLGTTSR